jgi:hypothetical protein
MGLRLPEIDEIERLVIGFGSQIERLTKIVIKFLVKQALFHKGVVELGHNPLPGVNFDFSGQQGGRAAVAAFSVAG